MKSALPWFPLIPLILIAIAFRFPMLDSLPPGLNFDEGGEGVAALDVLTGQFRIWWPIGGGKEPLMAYLVQPLFWIFGPTRLALRFYTALMGLGAVLGTYFVAYRLFRAEGEDKIKPIFIASAAALGLATAFWHVAYSRLAFRALSSPFVAAMAMGFLWQALKTSRWRDFTLAGIFIGLLAYTYLAGRFVPIAITLFFLGEAILTWRKNQQPYLWRYWPQLSLMVGLAILIFTPLALFFLQNPAAFVDRAGAVSIFNPQRHQGNFWGLLWQTTWTTLGTYLSLTGDPNSIANIPEQPMLRSGLAICFVLGWGYALRRWHNPSYLFLILWWAVLLLPAILAPEGAPHHLRLIGTGPSTYIFVALGIWALGEWVEKIWGPIRWRKTNPSDPPQTGEHRLNSPFWEVRGANPQRISLTLSLILFTFTGYQTYQNYFIIWANEVDHYMAYDVYAEELAAHLAAELDPNVVYVLPMDLRAAHEARHYSLDFLTWPKAHFHYLVVDEETMAARFTEAMKGKMRLNLVRWQRDKHQEADAKELVSYLLTRSEATLIHREDFPVYTIETYHLSQTVAAFPTIETPIDIVLDGLIQIRRAEVEALTNQVAAAIVYAPIAPIQADYKASLRLIAPDGHTIAQKDRTLRHNWHQPTSQWPGEEVNEYYLLPWPTNAESGLYEVKVVIYHPETLAPLTQNGLVEVPLGQIIIEAD